MNDDQFFAALDVARSKFKAVGRLDLCARPVQVALTVSTAQGIIDNGGLQYLYEVDFEDQSPYTDFVAAYQAIGAMDAAQLLERSIDLFPFSEPHLHESKRQLWLDQVRGDDGSEFNQLSDQLIGHKGVFSKLADFIQQNLAHFQVG